MSGKMVKVRRTIAVFSPGLDLKGEPRPDRYVAFPGYRAYRGMYKNRRRNPGRDIKPTLTGDREEAWKFSSNTVARKQLSRWYSARQMESFRFERVEVEEWKYTYGDEEA